MGYPRELDEMSDKEVFEEAKRRFYCRRTFTCYYCGKPLGNGVPCKIQPHAKQGIVLEQIEGEPMCEIATHLETMIPDGWGYCLVLARLNDPQGVMTHISTIRRQDAIGVLRSYADHLESGARGL